MCVGSSWINTFGIVKSNLNILVLVQTNLLLQADPKNHPFGFDDYPLPEEDSCVWGKQF